jgi:hypothetical protein
MKLKSVFVFTIVMVLLVACQATPTVAPTAVPPTTAPTNTPRVIVTSQPIPRGPVLLRSDITLSKVIDRIGGGDIRLVQNPKDKEIYLLNPGGGVYHVKLTDPASVDLVAATGEIFTNGVTPSGMAFGPDGALYVVGNVVNKNIYNVAIIRKGVADSTGKYTWTFLASTEPYPLSATNFDHLYNGIVVSPDGKYVYVNAGSRTDHGEVENNKGAWPDTREVPLTSAIMRIPADSKNLILPNDEAKLKSMGYMFADGTRNSYDPAFAPNGDLFAGENGPDADYPDEFNWLREGLHYGFPWRFGNQDLPQASPSYDPTNDKHLHQDFVAVSSGTYQNDPSFPKPPMAFTDPIPNSGPDGVQFRADDGTAHDVGVEGGVTYSFTPHRSPLGLVFVADNTNMPADLQGSDGKMSGFILSWGAAGGTLTDKGLDLLHIVLTKSGDSYTMTSEQVAREFKNPIDAVLIDNHLYVLEFGDGAAIWELTFNK